MKYASIDVFSKEVNATLQCSECGCQVEATDSYCRKCGHRLERLPSKMRIADVCDLLTRHAEELIEPKAECGEADKEMNRPASESPLGKEPGDDGIMRDFEFTMSGCESCPRCKPDARGCEFLDEGICRGVVYPTYPPQYGECVFQGKHNGKGGRRT